MSRSSLTFAASHRRALAFWITGLAVLALAGCDTFSRQAKLELDLAFDIAENGDLALYRERLTSLADRYSGSEVGNQAAAELGILDRLEKMPFPEADQAAEAVATLSQSVVPYWRGEQSKTELQEHDRVELPLIREPINSFHGLVELPLRLRQRPPRATGWKRPDPASIRSAMQSRVRELTRETIRVAIAARAIFLKNKEYKLNDAPLGSNFNHQVFKLTYIPSGWVKDKGYQTYTAEVMDRQHQYYMIVNDRLEFRLVLKPDEVARRLLNDDRTRFEKTLEPVP
ncbi:MAG: hypothetical protein GMKNLPBB_02239 [Myxococcota bacterium]|nr:hypothetical protein [Myxococcota bacterium]